VSGTDTGIGADADPNASNTNAYFTRDYSLTVGTAEQQRFSVDPTMSYTVSFGGSSATVPAPSGSADPATDCQSPLPGRAPTPAASGYFAVTSTLTGASTRSFTVDFGRAFVGIWEPLLGVTQSAAAVTVNEITKGNASTITGSGTNLHK